MDVDANFFIMLKCHDGISADNGDVADPHVVQNAGFFLGTLIYGRSLCLPAARDGNFTIVPSRAAYGEIKLVCHSVSDDVFSPLVRLLPRWIRGQR